MFSRIVSGGIEKLNGASDGEFQGPPSRAGAVSKSRTLIFKDVPAWQTYAARYSRGGLIKAVHEQIKRNSQNEALMQVLGPNPEAAERRLVQRLKRQAEGNAHHDAVRALDFDSTRAHYEQVAGTLNVPQRLRLAMMMRNVRAWETITKLGSVVASKVPDLPLTARTLARMGGKLTDGYLEGLEGRRPDGRRGRQADRARAGTWAPSPAGDMMSSVRIRSGDKSVGFMTWAAKMEHKLNTFDFVNEGNQRGAAVGWAAIIGGQIDRTFDKLEIGTRESFERWGIGPEEWDLGARRCWSATQCRACSAWIISRASRRRCTPGPTRGGGGP